MREIPFSGKGIRCILSHEYVLFRQGLRRLLEDEQDIEVLSEAANAAECLRKVSEFRPDVALIDAGTFGSALEAEFRVSRESPETKIIFLSTSDEPLNSQGDFQESLEACAGPRTSAEELVAILRKMCYGSAIREGEAGLQRRSGEALSSAERALTAREREVLKLLAEGKTVPAAAVVLGVSRKTVDAHKFNLMRKLGIHNKAELVMWAIQRKVVKVPVNF